MDPVHEINARRWRFLYENWNRYVHGVPFPEWLRRQDRGDFLATVDRAIDTLAWGRLNPPNRRLLAANEV